MMDYRTTPLVSVKDWEPSDEQPVFVVSKSIEKNDIVIGTKEDLFFTRVKIGPMNWVSGEQPIFNKDYEVKIRYKAKPQSGKLWKLIPIIVFMIFYHLYGMPHQVKS